MLIAKGPAVAVDIDSVKQRVSMSFSCRALKNLDIMSKSDPVLEVYLYNKSLTDPWVKVGETEQINNSLNPDFSTAIEVDYYFEKTQKILFRVWDIDNKQGDGDFVGDYESTVASCVTAKQACLTGELIDPDEPGSFRGRIMIRTDTVKMVNDLIEFKMHATL
jgi:hypothetical protein